MVGTHTHVPTSDTQILPKGTAYQTDAGMCGDYNSVIGMQKDEPLNRFVTGMAKGRFQPAKGEATLSGVFVETDRKGGAVVVSPVRFGGRLQQAGPD
jgi:calcineurin-like phosphoesterase